MMLVGVCREHVGGLCRSPSGSCRQLAEVCWRALSEPVWSTSEHVEEHVGAYRNACRSLSAACRELVGVPVRVCREPVGSLSAACREPVGWPCRALSGWLREPVRACRSMSEPSVPVISFRALSRSLSDRHKVNFPGEFTLWEIATPQSKFPRGNLLCGAHKVNFPGEIYFVSATK